MDLAAIDRVAYGAMGLESAHTAREPGWLYYHGRRTGKTAVSLAKQAGVDVEEDITYVGALFHDIGKGTEPHNEVGSQRAAEMLRTHCSDDDLEQISTIIRLHNQRDGSDHPDAVKLVQDADLLDHVGRIGIWLAFYWSGSNSESFQEHRDFIMGAENAHHRKEMRSSLNFEHSIEEFDLRIEFEELFFAEFHKAYLAKF